MRRLSIIILIVFFTGSAYTQSFIKIDSATYKQYLAGDWSELIREGKQAIRQDVDYYYLRMRLGIAYYEQKKFRAATGHFKKALEFNQDDPVAREYLYYSFLFSGQSERARVYRDSFTGKLSEKFPPENTKFVDAISAEYLYSKAQNDDIVNRAEQYFEGFTSGYQVLTRQYYNLNFNMVHRIKPSVSIVQAYTYLNKDNFMYYHDGLAVTIVNPLKIKQHQYYLSPTFTSASGFSVSPYFHFLSIGYQVVGSGGNGFGSGSQVSMVDKKTSAFAGGLALSQVAGPMNITLGGNYSNFNSTQQVLVRGGFSWYLKGNLDLYIGAYLNTQVGITENSIGYEVIPEYLFGARIISRIWIEVFGSHGDMLNYLEGNGYIAYNGLDKMKHKVSTNLVYPITDKGSRIYLGARWIQYQSSFTPFDTGIEQIVNPLTYNSLSIFGGISWRL